MKYTRNNYNECGITIGVSGRCQKYTGVDYIKLDILDGFRPVPL